MGTIQQTPDQMTARFTEVPRFEDQNTDVEGIRDGDRNPGHIGLTEGLQNALGLGKLQVTLECQNLNHARMMHDMLIPFAPLLISLSAASPIYKAQLSTHDHWWDVF